MAKQNLGGVYANMEFPPYEFREYPKHIKTGNRNNFEVANNVKEEEEIRSRLQLEKEVRIQAQEAEPTDPIRESLIKTLNKMNVPFNNKWSNTKLQMTIANAELETDNLPAIENVATENNELEETEEEDKDALIAQAKSLGINASRVWGIPRLKKEIAEAQEANAE
jgi:hypothetical protein